MAKIDGPFIILTEEERLAFHNQIIHPDPVAMARRDEFFAELDRMNIRENEDGSVEILDFELRPQKERIN